MFSHFLNAVLLFGAIVIALEESKPHPVDTLEAARKFELVAKEMNKLGLEDYRIRFFQGRWHHKHFIVGEDKNGVAAVECFFSGNGPDSFTVVYPDEPKPEPSLAELVEQAAKINNPYGDFTYKLKDGSSVVIKVTRENGQK